MFCITGTSNSIAWSPRWVSARALFAKDNISSTSGWLRCGRAHSSKEWRVDVRINRCDFFCCFRLPLRSSSCNCTIAFNTGARSLMPISPISLPVEKEGWNFVLLNHPDRESKETLSVVVPGYVTYVTASDCACQFRVRHHSHCNHQKALIPFKMSLVSVLSSILYSSGNCSRARSISALESGRESADRQN